MRALVACLAIHAFSACALFVDFEGQDGAGSAATATGASSTSGGSGTGTASGASGGVGGEGGGTGGVGNTALGGGGSGGNGAGGGMPCPGVCSVCSKCNDGVCEVDPAALGKKCGTSSCNIGLNAVVEPQCRLDGACEPELLPGCDQGFTCSNGECLLSLAAMCSQGFECASGNCVDGYCCNSPCTEVCRACDEPSAPGSCVLVEEGNPDICPLGHFCDTMGACVMTF